EPAIFDELVRLIAPVLPPVFGHHGLAQRAVFLHDAHGENVGEADEATLVAIYINALRAPGLVGPLALGVRVERRDFEKIERHPIAARHRENGAAIAFEAREARRL